MGEGPVAADRDGLRHRPVGFDVSHDPIRRAACGWCLYCSSSIARDPFRRAGAAIVGDRTIVCGDRDQCGNGAAPAVTIVPVPSSAASSSCAKSLRASFALLRCMTDPPHRSHDILRAPAPTLHLVMAGRGMTGERQRPSVLAPIGFRSRQGGRAPDEMMAGIVAAAMRHHLVDEARCVGRQEARRIPSDGRPAANRCAAMDQRQSP
jgi:hypothetical protein